MVYGMHPFPAFGSSKPSGYSEQYSGAELIRRTIATAGLPHSFLTNVQNFQAEAALWVTIGADVGLLRAASEDQRGGVRGVVDLAQLPDRRMRQGLPALPQRAAVAAAEEAAERDLLRALHDRLRRRRGAAGAASRNSTATSCAGRRTSITTTATTPGGRSRRCRNTICRSTIRPSSSAPTRGGCTSVAGAGEDHPRARHRDRAPGLVADRRGGQGGARRRRVRDPLVKEADAMAHFTGLRQRLPRRRTARALGEIPRSRVPHARQTRAVASGGRNELVSQGQRRDRSATR